jgi:membrane-associated protease RseP (regulator of RpoE activity)
VDALVIFLASWFVLVGLVYLLNRQAVKYFVAIYWKSERLVVYVKKFAEKLSFIPLKAYTAVALLLFLAPVFLAIPFIRPDGQVQWLQGFIYMLAGGTVNALNMLLGGASVGEAAAQSAGVTPIIPGVTLPWDQLPYLAVAVAVAVVLHELMHGYAALRYGIPVKSVGVFSLLYVLSGAFVEPDEESFKKAKTEAKVAVLASGVAVNVVLALAAMALGVVGAWLGLQGAVFGVEAYGVKPGDRVLEIQGCGLQEKIYTPDDFLTKINVLAGMGPLLGINKTVECKPGDKVTLVVGSWFGRYTVEVDYAEFSTSPKIMWLYTDGSLYRGGVRPGDVVKRIEGCGISTDITSSGQLFSTLREIRERCKAGDVIKVVVERNGTSHTLNVTLVEREGRIYFGLGPGSLPLLGYDEGPVRRDQLYNTDFTRLVFWLVVVNYGLAVLNALPIYPLDGGQLLAAVAQRRLGEKKGKFVVDVVTWALAAMLVFNIALGVLGEQYRVLQSIR